MDSELLLVGSIPLDTPQDVLQTFGAPLGKYLFAMPDGEVGPRRHWISRVHYQVLAAHPEIEVVQRPARTETESSDNFLAMPLMHGGSKSRMTRSRCALEIPPGDSVSRVMPLIPTLCSK
ncbi:MAG: hypothetical protein WBF24_05355 [Xanthobacteraceae bacterium]